MAPRTEEGFLESRRGDLAGASTGSQGGRRASRAHATRGPDVALHYLASWKWFPHRREERRGAATQAARPETDARAGVVAAQRAGRERPRPLSASPAGSPVT